MRNESLFIFGFALPNLVLNISESITIKCSFSSLVLPTVSSFYSVVVVNIPIFLLIIIESGAPGASSISTAMPPVLSPTFWNSLRRCHRSTDHGNDLLHLNVLSDFYRP